MPLKDLHMEILVVLSAILFFILFVIAFAYIIKMIIRWIVRVVRSEWYDSTVNTDD